MTSHPSARLNLGAATYAVIEIEPGPLDSLRLTLDRPLSIPPRCREPVLMLAQGANREPVRLLEPPAGARVKVRAVY